MKKKNSFLMNKLPFISRVLFSVMATLLISYVLQANIAEGNDALTTPDFISYLIHAKKSSAEVRSHLYDALDENYITKSEFEETCEQTRKVSRMLSSLVSYLQGIDQKRKRNSNQNLKPET